MRKFPKGSSISRLQTLGDISGDDFFCAFGTIMRKAGSKAALHRIDCEYPTAIATRLKNQGVKRVLLVSSVGANSEAGSFYLRTKGQLERNIVGLGFEKTVILRPSFLIGQRVEVRVGEQTAIFLLKLLSPFMFGVLQKYRGIEASAVAKCLVQAANTDVPGVRFIESDKIPDME